MFVEINDFYLNTNYISDVNKSTVEVDDVTKYLLTYVLTDGSTVEELFDTESEANTKLDEIEKSGWIGNLTNIYVYKGSCLYAQLPQSGNSVGDVWNVEDEFTLGGVTYPAGTNVAWAGSSWDVLAGTIDTSTFELKSNKTTTITNNSTDVQYPSAKAVYTLSTGLQSKITSSNKLDSDLVDDTNQTNKFVTAQEKSDWNAKSDFSGSYNDLTDKPSIPDSTSDLNNDSGFITNTVNDLTNYTKTTDLAAVATTGEFASLLHKPTTVSGYGITDAAKQVTTMPQASSSLVDSIVQYVGTTGTYINGYFYKCVNNSGTYAWEAVSVQAGGGGGTDWDYIIYATSDEISITSNVPSSTEITSTNLLNQLSQILTDGIMDETGKVKNLKIALHVSRTTSTYNTDYLYILNSIYGDRSDIYDEDSYTFVFWGTDTYYNDYITLSYRHGDGGSGIVLDEWSYSHYNLLAKTNTLIDDNVNPKISNFVGYYTTMPTAGSSYSNKVVIYAGNKTSQYNPGSIYKCVSSSSTYSWKQVGNKSIEQLSSMPTASSTYYGSIVQYIGTTTSTYTHGSLYECVNSSGTYMWEKLQGSSTSLSADVYNFAGLDTNATTFTYTFTTSIVSMNTYVITNTNSIPCRSVAESGDNGILSVMLNTTTLPSSNAWIFKQYSGSIYNINNARSGRRLCATLDTTSGFVRLATYDENAVTPSYTATRWTFDASSHYLHCSITYNGTTRTYYLIYDSNSGWKASTYASGSIYLATFNMKYFTFSGLTPGMYIMDYSLSKGTQPLFYYKVTSSSVVTEFKEGKVDSIYITKSFDDAQTNEIIGFAKVTRYATRGDYSVYNEAVLSYTIKKTSSSAVSIAYFNSNYNNNNDLYSAPSLKYVKNLISYVYVGAYAPSTLVYDYTIASGSEYYDNILDAFGDYYHYNTSSDWYGHSGECKKIYIIFEYENSIADENHSVVVFNPCASVPRGSGAEEGFTLSSPVLNLGKATGVIYIRLASSGDFILSLRFFANNSSNIHSIDNFPVNKKYVDDSTVSSTSALPTADVNSLGKIYQYTGSTTSSYTNGYFYKCVSDGAVSPTYSWEQLDVQPSGGGGTVWDYIIDARSVIDLEDGDINPISDAGLLTQLNQIITDGIYSSGTTIKPLNILLIASSNVVTDTVNLHLVSISDQTWYQEDTCYNFCFINEKCVCYLQYFDGTWSWRCKHLLLDIAESTLNKVTSITSGNKTSTTYYPSNKAIVDYIDDTTVLKIATLPTASADNLGKVYQFVGTTTSSYTNGFFYQCVSDGQATPTYSWAEYQVQSPAPMYIMSYGHSTWSDFITAYQKRLLVYCRASSNSNPGTGSQTRMAFMAYVNNATNPTEVEFQYYRSVSSHSASQQGDQVFVYKLTSNGTWTVITREASVKVVAGTGLTSTYSNNTITLKCENNEVTTNKVTSISSSSTDTQYPSAKCVYDAIGAIIDSGSDTNGNYIKYADGTMIEWNNLTVTDQALDNAYGSFYQGTRTITFPVAFVGSTPSCQCSQFLWGTSASWGSVVSADLVSLVVRGMDIAQRATGTNCTISWFAIGKWK